MSTKKFEDFLVSRCEYLKCVVVGGVVPGSKPHVTRSKEVLDMASRQFTFVGVVDCTTASRLVAIVTSSQMMPEDKHELIVRLNVKVDLDECADGSNPGVLRQGQAGLRLGQSNSLRWSIRRLQQRRRNKSRFPRSTIISTTMAQRICGKLFAAKRHPWKPNCQRWLSSSISSA